MQRLANRFVSMYVNDRTLDYGLDGRQAIASCSTWASNAGSSRLHRGWNLQTDLEHCAGMIGERNYRELLAASAVEIRSESIHDATDIAAKSQVGMRSLAKNH